MASSIMLTQIRQAWRPVMRRCGFSTTGASFARRLPPVEHRIHIQALRNRRDPEFLINLWILVDNPFETDHRAITAFTHAYLNPRGEPHAIRHHWSPESAAGAHDRVEEFAMPLFDRFASIDALIPIVDAASAHGLGVQRYLQGESAKSDWLVGTDSVTEAIGVPPTNDELMSLLHWHKGDYRRAIDFIERTLESFQGLDAWSVETRERLMRRIDRIASQL